MSRLEAPLPSKQYAIDKVVEFLICSTAIGLFCVYLYAICQAFRAH